MYVFLIDFSDYPLEILQRESIIIGMEEVCIIEVQNRSQLRKFVNFPNILYKDVPQFVPAFYGDDLSDWNRKKNPAFQYCEARAFLAYRGGQIVGRIGAILSHAANSKWNKKRMRFSQVDFIDDPEVSEKLFAAVEDWAREKGCTEVHGPLGFCDLDREGMLVEGFDQPGLFITYYNHPYYIRHLERLGYTKDIDWQEFQIQVPSKEDPTYQKVGRLSELVAQRGHFHKAVITSKAGFKPYIKKVFQLVNDAYADLYGVVTLVPAQIDKYASKFLPLVDPDYCCIVLDEKEELAGFGVCCPSPDKAIKKSRGRLFPTGWIALLKALKKSTSVDLLLIAVRPELKGSGVNAIILDHIMNSCIRNKIQYAETGPQLETNFGINSMWKSFDPKQHKRRRCFIKTL